MMLLLADRNNLSWTGSGSMTLPNQLSNPNSATYCTVAANYLNWSDLVAWLDWAGLRPMSELEYEKAARGSQEVVAGEFAWGIAFYSRVDGITDSGKVTDVPSQLANVNFASGVTGPMRIGSCADYNTEQGTQSRVAAGAGYFGGLELTGNVWEQVVTIGNSSGRGFDGSHGDGALTASGNADASWASIGAGLRGGAWNSTVVEGRTSERTYAATHPTARNNAYGGRGVRSISTPAGPTPTYTPSSTPTQTPTISPTPTDTPNCPLCTATPTWSPSPTPINAGACCRLDWSSGAASCEIETQASCTSSSVEEIANLMGTATSCFPWPCDFYSPSPTPSPTAPGVNTNLP